MNCAFGFAPEVLSRTKGGKIALLPQAYFTYKLSLVVLFDYFLSMMCDSLPVSFGTDGIATLRKCAPILVVVMQTPTADTLHKVKQDLFPVAYYSAFQK